MSKNPGAFEYVAGLDVGNGYLKGVIELPAAKGASAAEREPVVVDLPSVAATVTGPNLVPNADSAARSLTGDADWYDTLDVSFSSPLISEPFRRLIGKKALAAKSASVDEFDIIGHRSKAEQELSKVLVLSVLAGRAVADYVAATGGALPTVDGQAASLTVRATVALALPINEYARHRYSYAASFLGSGDKRIVHQVTLHNFETPVTVGVVFADVMVFPEGMSAQYAINDHPNAEKLMTAMLAQARRAGVDIDAEITAADLLAASNTIGVDVGEGTVNLPVHTNGKSNVAASRTLNKGYGAVLEGALVSLENSGGTTTFTGRKQLADFLQAPRTRLNAKKFAVVDQHLSIAAKFFAEEVAVALGRVLGDVGAMTEVIYVYGGGSGPMHEVLYPELVAKVAEMNSESDTPVLYLDAKYSRGLNREGLILAARNRAAKRAAR